MFPEVERHKIHALVHDSFALINSSVNEGMSGAILEVSTLLACRQTLSFF